MFFILPQSTINIYADITTPKGNKKTMFETIHDINRGESRTLILHTGIVEEGKYVIDVGMTSVGEDMIFDTPMPNLPAADIGKFKWA